MRFLHTADWHLGRIFYGQYLTDDQAHVLENQFFSILKDEKIDGILLAGDVFDRAVPPIEAIELWDSIITRLAMDYKVPLFVVSGNHDGAERFEVGRSMLSQSGIHIWGSPHHALQPFEFEGSDGKIAICPMPFSEPRRIGDALGLGTTASKTVDIDMTEDSLFSSVETNEQEPVSLNLHGYQGESYTFGLANIPYALGLLSWLVLQKHANLLLLHMDYMCKVHELIRCQSYVLSYTHSSYSYPLHQGHAYYHHEDSA